MTKTADIGSKRLISLAPATWVRWVTGDPTAEALDFLSGEFEWVSRATDVLIKARSERHGVFLVVNEIQFRPDLRMPQRIRVYAALAEEHFGLEVYPVVINLLPPRTSQAIATSYHSELMGLVAHQDFKVLNLWEVDSEQVLAQRWSTLLPFVPVMRGGQSRAAVSRALALVRDDVQLAEMEPLLAFFATFVMTSDEVVKLMRWNMVMLRESPWYLEIEAEAMQKGLQQGQQQGQQLGQAELVLRLLARRFDAVPAPLAGQVQALPSAQMPALLDAILDAGTLEEVAAALERLAAVASNGQAA